MQFSLYFFFWKIHDTASEKNICQCFHLCRNVEFSFCHKWKQSKCHSRVNVWILEHFYSNYKQPLKVFCKKGALRKFKKFRQSTCARVSFLIRPATLLKKRLWHWCFPVNFAKFLRTNTLFIEQLWEIASELFRKYSNQNLIT